MTKKQTYAIAVLWIFAVILSCAAGYVTFYNRGYTEVCFIDVEQGDSCFIQTDKLSSVLIDGGDKGEGEYTLIPFLRTKSVMSLDAVFVSHLHSDHLSGIAELIEADFKIGKLYVSPYAKENENYPKLKELADSKSIPIFDLRNGDTVEIDNTSFTSIKSDAEYKEENDTSLVLRFDCGENSILFTGDITKTAEADLLENPLIDTDILKVAHHGSSGSSGEDFIKEVSPELSVISVGEDNKYNHPSKRVLDTLSGLDVPVVRTDYDGTISLIMTEDDIKNIDFSRERGKNK